MDYDAIDKYRQLDLKLRDVLSTGTYPKEKEEAERAALQSLWAQLGKDERDYLLAEEEEVRASEAERRAADARFEPCDACSSLRETSQWTRAKNCYRCRGQGFVRKAESYACNRCGGAMGLERDRSPYGLVEQTVSGHYESVHLSDCTTYTFSLCEKCLRELFDSFRVPPAVGHYMGGGRTTYAEDADWYRFTIWRDAGGQRAKLETGICNHREHCDRKAIWRHMLSGDLTVEATCDEHKLCYSNSHNVPVEAVAGIPYEPARRTREHKEQIAAAYMTVVLTDRERPSYIQFLSASVMSMLRVQPRFEHDAELQDEDLGHSRGWSGVFVPAGVSTVVSGLNAVASRHIELALPNAPAGLLIVQEPGGFDSWLANTPPSLVARPRW